MLDEKEIRELVGSHGAIVSQGRLIKQLIEDAISLASPASLFLKARCLTLFFLTTLLTGLVGPYA